MFYAFNREYSSRTHYSECCWYHYIRIRSTKIFAPLSSFVDHVFVFSSLTSYSPCMLALHDSLKHHNVLYHVYVFVFSALTSYSPCMLALHDMLKQQLELTKSFLHSQQSLYQSMSSSLDHKYRYTTLQDTKKVHTLKVTASEPLI